MSEFEDVNKLWDEFEFPFEPSKETVKILLKEITLLTAWNIAMESIFTSELEKLTEKSPKVLRQQIKAQIERNFYELSADKISRFGSLGQGENPDLS